MRDQIVNAMAKLAWALAWANHADEHGCCNMSGVNVFDVMPQEVPECSAAYAGKLAAEIEAASGVTLDVLFNNAADNDPTVNADSSREIERFGECLVYESMGHGVAWTDDHDEEVPSLVLPHSDDYESRAWADEHCTDKGKRTQMGCGHYAKPRSCPGLSRCPDCGSLNYWVTDTSSAVVHYVPTRLEGWALKVSRGRHWAGRRKHVGAVRRFLRACKAA